MPSLVSSWFHDHILLTLLRTRGYQILFRGSRTRRCTLWTRFVRGSVKGVSPAPAAHREHVRPRSDLDHEDHDDDAIRPKVRRPHHRAGDAEFTERERKNRGAIGGLRNPRCALQ